jgi:MFS family permease
MTSTAIASMSATLGVGGAIGLPLAAWVVQTFDFHALFWMAAVFAALLLAGLVTLVPRVNDAQGGRVDLVGAVGLAVGLVGVLLGASKGREWGWLDGRTVGSIVVGLVVLGVWGVFELGQDQPLVDLRATAYRPVLLTNVAAVAIGFGMMAQAIVVPQLLQLPTSTGYGLGQTVLQAGLWMAPGGLMMLVFAPVSSRLMTTIGPKRTLMIGAAVLSGGYLVAFFLMNAPWQLLVASVVASSGVGIGYAAMPALIMASTPPREAGSALGVNALSRSIGTTVASAVMATVLAGSTGRSGFELCFAIGAAAALVGVVITALVPHAHQRAAATEVAETVPA